MSREEFEQRRAAGLRKRHTRRLQQLGEHECDNCSATTAGCETLRWLAGRACCDQCDHNQGTGTAA